MSRRMSSICAMLLGLGMAALIGCGSKPEPEKSQPEAKTEAAATPTQNPGSTPEAKVEAEKSPYEMDPSKHIVPNRVATETVGGTSFVPEAAVEGDYLVFRSSSAPGTPKFQEIRLRLGQSNEAKQFEKRKLTISQELPTGPDVPEIMVYPAQPREALLYPNGYALTLETGNRLHGKLPGKIYLCLPDAEKTVLAGGFEAAYPRQPSEPPESDDLPFLKGLISTIGVAPNSTVRFGYVTNPNADEFEGSIEISLREPAIPIQWTQSDRSKKPISTLIAGDGKATPSRYELSKVPSGRYLVFAAIQNGPIAWKWLSVMAGEVRTADLKIDATQTGGVEVIVPPEAVKSVQMVPIDAADSSAFDKELFSICSLQLGQFGLEMPIVMRKALFKNLTPGRYLVRAGGEYRAVEIVVGKTVELSFDAQPAAPPKVDPKAGPKDKQ